MSRQHKKKRAVERPSGGTRQNMQEPTQEQIEQLDAQTEAITQEETKVEAAMPPEAAKELQKQLEDLRKQVQDALQKAEEAQKKADEYLGLAQRVQADFDNYRRRNQTLRHDAYEEGTRSFATTLLPVLDNFERALNAAKDTSDPALRDGIQMVQRQMCDAFDKRGIKPISRKGEKFDPTLENAVLQGTAEDGEPGTVCEVLQKGYELEGAVLRHAMVKVVPD